METTDAMDSDSFGSVWQRFLETPETMGATPGAREAWHRGRERYAVWLLRVRAPTVLARLDWSRQVLQGHIEPMLDRAAHVTTFVVGFPTATPSLDDDVDEAELSALVASLRADPPLAPRLVIGGLNAFLSCAFLEVMDPHGDLRGLRERLAGGIREIRFSTFHPHVTAGLFTCGPTAPIAEAIEPLRGLPPMLYQPESLELAEFDAKEEGSALVARETVPFRVR